MSVLFSIVIPAFNRVSTICDTIDSVLQQPHADCEIIVVDDGSTDGTADRIRERFGGQVRVVVQENAGPGAARNRGAAQATGQYLAFLDSDDLWFPWTLATYREVLSDAGFPGLVTSVPFPFEDQLTEQPRSASAIRFDRFADYYSSGCTHRSFGSGVLLVRRDVFGRCGGFTTDLINGEDLDFILRIGNATEFVEVTAPPLTGWRQHAGNLTLNAQKTAEGLLHVIANEKAGKYPGGIQRQRERREIIARHARSAALAAATSSNRCVAWSLYLLTMTWHLQLRRWKFFAGFPLTAFMHSKSGSRSAPGQPQRLRVRSEARG